MPLSILLEIFELRIKFWNWNNHKNIRIPQVSIVWDSHILSNWKYIIKSEKYLYGGRITDEYPCITLAVKNISNNPLLLKSVELEVLSARENYRPLVHLWTQQDTYMADDDMYSSKHIAYQDVNYGLEFNTWGDLIINLSDKSYFKMRLIIDEVKLIDSDWICFFNSISKCKIVPEFDNREYKIVIPRNETLVDSLVKIDEIVVGYHFYEYKSILWIKFNSKSKFCSNDKPIKLFYDPAKGYYHLSDELGAWWVAIEEIEIEEFEFTPSRWLLINHDLWIKYQLLPKHITKVRLCLKPTYPCFIHANIILKTDEWLIKKNVYIEYNFKYRN